MYKALKRCVSTKIYSKMRSDRESGDCVQSYYSDKQLMLTKNTILYRMEFAF